MAAATAALPPVSTASDVKSAKSSSAGVNRTADEWPNIIDIGAAVNAILIKLPELVSRDRPLLPSKYMPALRTLIAERDETLLKVVTKYSLIPNLTELCDSVDGVVVDRLSLVWDHLFAACTTATAKALSSADQNGSSAAAAGTVFDGLRYVYGEVTFSSLARFICKYVPVEPAGIRFYDVGSGTGRGVFLGALLHSFDACSGVEILPSLHRAGVEVLNKYQSDVLGPVDILINSDAEAKKLAASAASPPASPALTPAAPASNTAAAVTTTNAAGAATSATATAALANLTLQPSASSASASKASDASVVDTSHESSALLARITTVTHSETTAVATGTGAAAPKPAVAGSGVTTVTVNVNDPDAGKPEYMAFIKPPSAAATAAASNKPKVAVTGPTDDASAFDSAFATTVTTTTNAAKRGSGPVITLIRGDMRVVPWTDAELIFANSTCFDTALFNEFSKQAEACVPGTRVITFTKEITSKKFRVIAAKDMLMSWGSATVILHVRLTDAEAAKPYQPKFYY